MHAELSTDLSVCWQQGTSDIESYIDWIASCRVLVTNDSLGLHIGLALGKPVIALFGPTIASEVDGAGLVSITPAVSWECIPCVESFCVKETPCMNYISVQVVSDAVRAKLTGTS